MIPPAELNICGTYTTVTVEKLAGDFVEINFLWTRKTGDGGESSLIV